MRKVDGIYQQSLGKIKGGHDIFDLHSHRVITRRNIIKIPISKAIIKYIEEMASHDKVTSLKFNNRAGVIYDNEWTAGVEYKN